MERFGCIHVSNPLWHGIKAEMELAYFLIYTVYCDKKTEFGVNLVQENVQFRQSEMENNTNEIKWCAWCWEGRSFWQVLMVHQSL